MRHKLIFQHYVCDKIQQPQKCQEYSCRKHEQPILTKEIIIENLSIISTRIPESFSGLKICHLSDIHNVDIFETNKKLLNEIINEEPNLIIISGDSTHDHQIKNALKTITKDLISVVPSEKIFVGVGNHEFIPEPKIDVKKEPSLNEQKQISSVRTFTSELQKNGVNILRNNSYELKNKTDSIFIVSVDDPQGYTDESSYVKFYLDQLIPEIPNNKFTILISHRPEKINLYSKYNIDLVFSGHAHGGQIKLPFINRGVIAPHQGLFPKYIDGVYQSGNLQEIVSPGLSDEFTVPRWKNPGKIYMVTLRNH